MCAAFRSDFAMFSHDRLKQRCTVRANRQLIVIKAYSRLSGSFFHGLAKLSLLKIEFELELSLTLLTTLHGPSL